MAAESTDGLTDEPTSDLERSDGTPVVEMRNISKSFGSIQALSGVDLEVGDNEIMGLVGDNGAGKSTLVKTLVGIHEADEGEVYVDGQPVDIDSPRDARQHGIATVYQDLAMVDELSVAANTFLGRPITKSVAGLFEIIDWDRMEEEAARVMRENLNLEIDPEKRVEFLSGGERQAVAINRALVTDPRLVIMDEPTSALSTESADRVKELVRQLKDEGMSVLVISHNLDEVFDLTDRITVIAHGEKVGTVDTDNINRDEIVQMMISGEMPPRLRE
jgi:ABC-type sugar transport system ATPase subunit